MVMTEYGRAKVHSEEFKEHLNMRLIQLFVMGKGSDDIRGMFEVYVAMCMCMGPDNRVAIRDGEIAAFINKHMAEIDQVIRGAMAYAAQKAGMELWNPTRAN